jgi:hypothetical protein
MGATSFSSLGKYWHLQGHKKRLRNFQYLSKRHIMAIQFFAADILSYNRIIVEAEGVNEWR